MSILDSVKRAPRWAWWTVGGVTLGAAALKVYKDRAAPDPEVEATEGETPGDIYSGSQQPATAGGSPPGVIVPPVIVPNDGGSAGDIAGAIGGVLGGAFTDLTGALVGIVGGTQSNIETLITQGGQTNAAIIDALANGGPAPQPVMVNPTPVIVQAPPPAAPPVAVAPAPPKPCCLYNGRPLSYWRQNQRNGKWGWPDGQGYIHTRAFEGNKACDGGGSAPGDHREC